MALTAGIASADTTVVGFESGTQGWSGPSGIGGGTTIDVEDGTPAPSLRTVFNDFGITFRTTSNTAWVRDFTEVDSVTFSLDTLVRQINFFGQDVSRPWLLELRDYDSGAPGYPWASVWYKFADISEASHGAWTTFSVTIADTGAADLPAGWRGYGDEDPVTFEPILPAGVTFAQILAGVDEVVYTTLEPGFFFGFTDHDVAIDTVTVTTEAGPAGCNAADNAEPFGVLDLADVQGFIAAFRSQGDAADVAAPFGVWDLADVQGFIAAFTAGCP
jgi:hypothetical protein